MSCHINGIGCITIGPFEVTRRISDIELIETEQTFL